MINKKEKDMSKLQESHHISKQDKTSKSLKSSLFLKGGIEVLHLPVVHAYLGKLYSHA